MEDGGSYHGVGERCHIQNFKGTVRYVGEVPPTEGVWYGVEWDTERGKNDGMVHGKRYFQCKDKFGSFVRALKINFGVDANTGFENQYGNGKLSENEAIVLNERTNGETVIEMIGFDKLAMKQSNYESLIDANLSGANISHSAQHGLEQISPRLTSLNLSDNLLSSLWDVYKIAGSLKKLKSLNISGNRLSDWNTRDVDTNFAFVQLHTLYINKMQLQWHQLVDIMKLVPNVKEVHSCFNEIQNIQDDIALKHIEVLNLEGNRIKEWKSVMNLATLPKLKKLILNGNQIDKVEIHKGDDGSERPFQNLSSLSLSNNHITDWNSVNVLNNLNSLTELRFRDNPVCEGLTGFGLRQELIARVENLKVLNGSEIGIRERKTAEMMYVKKYSCAYYTALREGSGESFNHVHPKYSKLTQTYGLPEEQVKVVKSLKDNLISLDIKCPDCEDKADSQKKVPSTMSLQQLKGILQRLYKVPTSKQRISYLDSKNLREIQLDDNMKQLCFYSISSGDTLYLRW